MPELSPHAARGLAHACATARHDPSVGFILFAYGSMALEQPFPTLARRPARLVGHRRAWTLHDPVRRGTPDRPGRVLTLEPDGVTEGVALTVAASHADAALHEIFAQELLLPWYRPAWVTVATADGDADALAFLEDPASPHRAPGLSADALAHLIATREGDAGPNAEYLHDTVRGLRAHRIADAALEALLARVEARAA